MITISIHEFLLLFIISNIHWYYREIIINSSSSKEEWTILYVYNKKQLLTESQWANPFYHQLLKHSSIHICVYQKE